MWKVCSLCDKGPQCMLLKTITCLSTILHNHSWYKGKYFDVIIGQQSFGLPGEKYKAILYSPEHRVYPSFAKYLPSNRMGRAYLWKLLKHKNTMLARFFYKNIKYI